MSCISSHLRQVCNNYAHELLQHQTTSNPAVALPYVKLSSQWSLNVNGMLCMPCLPRLSTTRPILSYLCRFCQHLIVTCNLLPLTVLGCHDDGAWAEAVQSVQVQDRRVLARLSQQGDRAQTQMIHQPLKHCLSCLSMSTGAGAEQRCSKQV